MHQTLGYGKEKDPLTDKRLAALSDVRLDRVRPAIQAVLDSGIFDRVEAKRYDWCYSIGATYLAEHEQACLTNRPNEKVQFFTPALPKNGRNLRKTDTISEKQTHTSLDLNAFLPSLQQLLQVLIPAPAISAESLTDSISTAMNQALQPLIQNLQQLNQPLHQATNPAAMRVASVASNAGGGDKNKEPSTPPVRYT